MLQVQILYHYHWFIVLYVFLLPFRFMGYETN
jgi:hypothetical protein